MGLGGGHSGGSCLGGAQRGQRAPRLRGGTEIRVGAQTPGRGHGGSEGHRDVGGHERVGGVTGLWGAQSWRGTKIGGGWYGGRSVGSQRGGGDTQWGSPRAEGTQRGRNKGEMERRALGVRGCGGVLTPVDALELLLLPCHAGDAGAGVDDAGGHRVDLRWEVTGRCLGRGTPQTTHPLAPPNLGLHVIGHVVGGAAQRDLPHGPGGVVGEGGRQDADPQLPLNHPPGRNTPLLGGCGTPPPK